MKKVISILLCLSVIFSLAIPAAAINGYTDVKDGAWYYDNVMKATERGYMTGTGNNKFSPDETMTRAMFVQLLANYTSNYNAAAYKGKSNFTDVGSSEWYAPAVEWAYSNDIVSGTSSTTFSPDGNLTRQEMVKMLYNYAIKTGNDTMFSSAKLSTYTDRNRIAGWAMEAMGWATDKGIINGTSITTLSPTHTTIRAEVATMIVNAENTLSKKEIDANGSETPPVNEPEEPVPDDNNNVNIPEPDEKRTGKSAVDANGGYYDYDLSNAIMEAVNDLRVQEGLPELKYSLYLQDLNDIRSKEVCYVVENKGVIMGQGKSHTRPDGTLFSTVGFGADMENNTQTSDYSSEIQYNADGSKFIETLRVVDIGNGMATHHYEKVSIEQYLKESGMSIANAWYRSEGHRRNMVSVAANTATISCYAKDGWIYITNLFSTKPYYILDLTE